MTESEQQELLAQLMTRAKEHKHSKFMFICCIGDYYEAREYRRSVLKTSFMFKQLMKKTLKVYYQAVKHDDDDLAWHSLLSYSSFKFCMKFYHDDAGIIKDEMSEYRAYLRAGNLLNSAFGKIRNEDELFDYRMAEIRNLADRNQR